MAVHLEFDESGSADVILVSMQIATLERAKKLKRAWNSELKKAKVKYFHAVDFKKAVGEGVFGHLERMERTVLLGKLSGFIRSKAEIGLSSWVNIKQYDQQTTSDYRAEFGTAYTHAINTLMLGAHLYCEAFHLGHDVHILIEDGHKNSDQAAGILKDMQKANGHPDALFNIMTVGTGCKKDSPLLQSADMLAYGEWQKLSNGRQEIYNALHVEGSKYKPEILNVNEFAETFVSGAAESKAKVAMIKRLWWEQNYGSRQRAIPEIQSDSEAANSSPPQQNQGKIRS